MIYDLELPQIKDWHFDEFIDRFPLSKLSFYPWYEGVHQLTLKSIFMN